MLVNKKTRELSPAGDAVTERGLARFYGLLAQGPHAQVTISTHRPLSSSFWGLPYRSLNISHKKELLRGLWVGPAGGVVQGIKTGDDYSRNSHALRRCRCRCVHQVFLKRS